MFYNRLKQLCKSKNTSITAVLKALNISTSKGTAWKNGSAPSSEIVIKLAEYFDVSTDFLLGLSDELHRKIKLSNVEIILPSYPNKKTGLFYENFISICKECGKKPTNVIAELGLSAGNLSKWKNGVVPKGNTLEKIATYFNVTSDSLLGIEKAEEDFLTQRLIKEVRSLSDEDLQKVIEYAELLKLKSNDKK